MPHFYFSKQHTLVKRFQLPGGVPGGGQLGHELSLEVWGFTPRFDLPGVGLATSVDLGRHAVNHWTQSLPLDWIIPHH